MSSTNELRELLTGYCNNNMNIFDTEIAAIDIHVVSVKNFLTKVSEDLRCELLSSITDSVSHTLLTRAANKGHTELCVTLLSSLPPADRLKLILVNKLTALH